MSNALVVYDKVTNPIEFCNEMALTMTALVGCSIDQGKAISLDCLCQGKTPMEYARENHFIQGKPTRKVDSLLADFRTKFGGDFEIVERSCDRSAIKLTRDGKEFDGEFTWSEAQESRWPWKDWKDHSKGLKDNWATPTDRKKMLWARVASDSLDAFCPELKYGICTPEEVDDYVDVESRTIDTTAAKPKTASEVLSKQAEAADDSDTIDASFTVTPDAPAPATESETASESQQGEAETAICGEIRELYEDLEVPQEKQDAALAKRGVKLLRQLPEDQAKQLRAKLGDLKRARDAAKN